MPHVSTGQPTRAFSGCLSLLGAIGLAVLAGGRPTPVAGATAPAKALPADLALVPSDAAAFLSLEVGKHWNGKEAKALQNVSQAHPIVVTWWARDLAKEIGIPPAESGSGRGHHPRLPDDGGLYNHLDDTKSL